MGMFGNAQGIRRAATTGGAARLAAAALATLAATRPCPAMCGTLRFTGAPLTRSVMNEADAAIDRACAWLASRQDQNGSWQGDAKATSVCLMALAGSGEQLPSSERATIDRGVAWLESAAAGLPPEASAWRGIALAVLAPSGNADPGHLFADEASLAASHGIAVTNLTSLVGGDGVPADAEKAFWFAHMVNRALGGELPASDGAPADWRGPLARRWTTSQLIDERGRGFWGESAEETAFAVLLLKEL